MVSVLDIYGPPLLATLKQREEGNCIKKYLQMAVVSITALSDKKWQLNVSEEASI